MLASSRSVAFTCVCSLSFLFACGGTTTDATDRRGVQNAGGAGALGGDAGESSGGASGGGGASGAGGFILRPPSLHRSSADACSRDRGPGDFDPFNPSDGGSPCAKDADCTAGENGRCMKSPYGGVGLIMIRSDCTYDACFTDGDCGTGLACACGLDLGGSREGNACVHAECHVDTDCGPGGSCSLSMTSQYCASPIPDGYYCRTPRDTCVEDTDCDLLNHCAYAKELGHWACVSRSLCSG